jgi:periplasmic copper chaperone A
MIRKRLLAALAVVAALAIPAGAYGHEYKLGELTIEHPWSRASIGAAKASAAYMEMVNEGTTPDLLIAVSSPIAEHVQLHTNLIEGGVLKMRPLEAVEISPGEPTILQPGGIHIMLMGLKAPLKEGDTFPLKLTFERAGTITVQVIVQGMDMNGGGDHETHQDSGGS